MPSSEQQETGWSFKQEDTAETQVTSPKKSRPNLEEISWTASEFIDHQKGAGWYVLLLGAVALLAGLIYVFTKDLISVVATVIVGLLFGVLAGRKPRELPYRVSNQGVNIGDKHYPYQLFKSFAIIREGALGCINFLPTKRFMPDISIYFPPNEETKIIEVLASNLPNEQRKEQSVDRLMKRLRF